MGRLTESAITALVAITQLGIAQAAESNCDRMQELVSENEEMYPGMMRDLQIEAHVARRWGDTDGANRAINQMRAVQAQRAALIEQAARVCAYEQQGVVGRTLPPSE